MSSEEENQAESGVDSWVTSVVKIDISDRHQAADLLYPRPNFTGAVRIIDGQTTLSAREPLVVSARAGFDEKQQAAEDSARQFGRPCRFGFEVIDSHGELLEAGPLTEIE